MDRGARLWLARAVRANYWRVSSWYDLDDVMQEGYYAYYYMERRYPDVTEPRHKMALFKLVFHSVITNLANQHTRRADEVVECDIDTRAESCDGWSPSFLDTVQAEPSADEADLVGAPRPVRDAIALMASGDPRLRAPPSRPQPVRRHRETLNDRLCRLTGYDPDTTDIVGGIREALAT